MNESFEVTSETTLKQICAQAHISDTCIVIRDMVEPRIIKKCYVKFAVISLSMAFPRDKIPEFLNRNFNGNTIEIQMSRGEKYMLNMNHSISCRHLLIRSDSHDAEASKFLVRNMPSLVSITTHGTCHIHIEKCMYLERVNSFLNLARVYFLDDVFLNDIKAYGAWEVISNKNVEIDITSLATLPRYKTNVPSVRICHPLLPGTCLDYDRIVIDGTNLDLSDFEINSNAKITIHCSENLLLPKIYNAKLIEIHTGMNLRPEIKSIDFDPVYKCDKIVIKISEISKAYGNIFAWIKLFQASGCTHIMDRLIEIAGEITLTHLKSSITITGDQFREAFDEIVPVKSTKSANKI